MIQEVQPLVDTFLGVVGEGVERNRVFLVDEGLSEVGLVGLDSGILDAEILREVSGESLEGDGLQGV